MTAVLAGIDVGTSAVKGLAIDAGRHGARAGRGRLPALDAAPGLGRAGSRGLVAGDRRRCSRSCAPRPGRRPGSGSRGQMHGLVALDGADRVLRPAILWNDQRTGAECAEIEATIGLERLIELTGNRALPGFTAPKLLWLRRHEPDVYARIARIALPKDYVRLRLCGEHATDVSDASGTLLLDVAARRWSEPVLDALEIDRAWLPAVLESPALSGHTADGVPVAAGAGDQAAGALGVGVDGPGPASVVLGTSGVVFAAPERYARRPAGSRARLLPRRAGRLARDGGDALGRRLAALAARRRPRPGVAYDELIAEAASVAGGQPRGCCSCPTSPASARPHADPDARGAFVGLSLRHDRGALVRAVLEGVAYGLRDSLELIARARRRARPSAASRAAARAASCGSQIVASVLELPLERVAVDEGAAFGAAILGGVAAGVWPDVHGGGRRDGAHGRAGSSPSPSGSRSIGRARRATARSTRRCATVVG